jgi:fatty-acyl-CoA synthase
VAETLQQLLRERLDQDTPALKFGEQAWTWREHLADAAALIGVADRDRPSHVGTLLGNTVPCQ